MKIMFYAFDTHSIFANVIVDEIQIDQLFILSNSIMYFG